MRFTRTAGVTCAALALCAVAVPAVAYAGDFTPPDVTPEPLTISADVAAKVQAALGRPSDSPLCGPQTPVLLRLLDGDTYAHVLFCVDPAVAAEVQAELDAGD